MEVDPKLDSEYYRALRVVERSDGKEQCVFSIEPDPRGAKIRLGAFRRWTTTSHQNKRQH